MRTGDRGGLKKGCTSWMSRTSSSQPTTHKGVLPFENILEIGQHQPIPIAYIKGEVTWDKKEKEINWIQAKENSYGREYKKLEQGSRLRTGLDYCEYLYSDLSSLGI